MTETNRQSEEKEERIIEDVYKRQEQQVHIQ